LEVGDRKSPYLSFYAYFPQLFISRIILPGFSPEIIERTMGIYVQR
jgi:hypothetical protein